MLFISKIIIDVSNRADNNNVSEFTDLLGNMYSNIVNLKEVWLSSKVDIIKYIRDLHKATVNPVFPQYRQYEEQSSIQTALIYSSLNLRTVLKLFHDKKS